MAQNNSMALTKPETLLRLGGSGIVALLAILYVVFNYGLSYIMNKDVWNKVSENRKKNTTAKIMNTALTDKVGLTAEEVKEYDQAAGKVLVIASAIVGFIVYKYGKKYKLEQIGILVGAAIAGAFGISRIMSDGDKSKSIFTKLTGLELGGDADASMQRSLPARNERKVLTFQDYQRLNDYARAITAPGRDIVEVQGEYVTDEVDGDIEELTAEVMNGDGDLDDLVRAVS